MVYGLWFEPERVVAGTGIHRQKPEWCLSSTDPPGSTYLLNFGLPEVQDYFFGIVKGFMDLPGFRFYRQDFNMDPLPYWQHNDAPDRQGITEIKYLEGLYAFWERLAATWPDLLMEGCSSGGRRIDLESISRMHMHQKTDYWFDNEVDQQSLWGLSQYLPNVCFVAHLCRMDDYSFHSTMASSLCLGWIADDPHFDLDKGKRYLEKYLSLRHLLIGEWYPLLPASRRPTDWTGSQYNRSDLGEGMILVFRHAGSPYSMIDAVLHGIDTGADYELTYDSTGQQVRAKGADLAKKLSIALSEEHSSELIVYKRVKSR
jgi:alpha-galactosidase